MRAFRLALFAVLIAAAALAKEKREFDYIYAVSGNHQIVAGGSINIGSLGKIADRYGDRFFWFRYRGTEYVIRDESTLGDIDGVFSYIAQLEPQRDDIRRRLRPLEQRERDLDRKIDALEDRMDKLEDRDDAAAERDHRALEAQMRTLERQMRELEREMERIEREEERFDQKEEALEDEAERKLLPILQRAIRSGAAKRP